MRRIIRSISHAPARPPAVIDTLPDKAVLSLDATLHRTVITATVKTNEAVCAGDMIAEGPHTCLHSPFGGTVHQVTPAAIEIVRDKTSEFIGKPLIPPKKEQWPEFLRNAGLTGMGGSMFPYARKISAAIDAKVHTLVINAVECEPGVEIDEGILVHDTECVIAGAKAVTAALNISRRVIAMRKSRQKYLMEIIEEHGFEQLIMPDFYPTGAAKLIVRKLHGKLPAPGIHNSSLGYLVMCATSLWALGRYIQEGRPSVDRPLTVLAPGKHPQNLIVPIGTSAEHILNTCGIRRDTDHELLVAQGRMMGNAVTPQYTINKGTIALFVIPAAKRINRKESPCILCGSCFDACPLHLHPIGMAERIRSEHFSRSLKTQLGECFLCGACSAVCPADIPLTDIFREEKQCIRE